jgi:hypothetical protein
MSTNPWTSGILSRKFAELVSVALNAACTNLNADGTDYSDEALVHQHGVWANIAPKRNR